MEAVRTSDAAVLNRAEPTTQQRVFSQRNLLITGALVVGAILAFAALDKLFAISMRRWSITPYYVLQAWSWLHGRWDIDPTGTSRIDIIMLHGKYYSIYAPFPAVMLLPFVAIFGPTISDIIFTIVVSGINLGVLYLLLEQLRALGLTHRSPRENVAWSLLLYFGSIAVWLSMNGGVWYTAHVVAAGCLLVSLLLAFRGHYFWSAVALGCGFMTRSTLILGFPLIIYLAWEGGKTVPVEQALSSWRALRLSSLRGLKASWHMVPWGQVVTIVAVAVAFLGLYMWRNEILFGNPLESGYSYNVAVYPVKHGIFNWRYVPANIISTFLNLPRFVYKDGFDAHPKLDMLNGPGNGISVFLTSPLFLLLFWRNRPKSLLQVALWATTGLMLVFVLFYFTAGFYQFGTRYLFDFYPYIWVLFALSQARLSPRIVLLGLFGIFVNYLGAAQFWGHKMYF